jgi:hypothetical protein
VGSWTQLVSGHGSAAIDGGTGQFTSSLELQVTAINSPRIRQLDDESPIQLQYAGIVGLGIGAPGSITATQSKNWNYDHVFHVWNTSDYTYCETAWWKLPPGMEGYFSIYW